MPSDHRLPRCFCLGVDSEDSVETRAARGLCLVSEWHVRDIFVPWIRTESTSACLPPPVFWRAGRRGASGGGVRWGAARLGGAGRNFRFFNFRVRWPRNSIRGQTIMAKQTAPLEAAVSPSSGRFQVVCGGDRTPWCGVRPSVHWQMRGRPIQHRAGLPPGAAHRREATVVFACSPPPDSQPPPGLHDETARQPAPSLENERAARATVRSRAQRRRAKPAGRSSA